MAEANVDVSSERAERDYLLSARAVRERALVLFEAARQGELEHFRLNLAALPAVVERVLSTSRHHYPDLRKIPYHGRYRHFDAGGVPRLERFEASLAALTSEERLRRRTELVITSVLLDAGAGPDWQYREADGRSYARSEGLAVASYDLFQGGALSSTGEVEADAAGLIRFDAAALSRAFQVSAQNPLTGVDGRARLLTRLGEVVAHSPDYFRAERPRLGDLGVYLLRSAEAGRLPAARVLEAVLGALGPIWPGREELAGRSLGDVWRHTRFGLIPFHKLSQWLSYSLIEPLAAAGVSVVGLGDLTGLPEYRNGGLLLDAGVLELVDAKASEQTHAVSSDLVIEWRALTVALLDEIATGLRARLGLTEAELPLASVLEGGTWQAGRAIAAELRGGGGPPLRIESDGTVF